MSVYPNLFIPGFPKSGTSSLYHYLTQHEAIDGVANKEPHVLTSAERFDRRDEIYDGRFDTSTAYQYRLDASTTYMIAPEAAHRMQTIEPDSKIIVVARDPIERVFSHYNWLWCAGQVYDDFATEIRHWDGRPFEAHRITPIGYKYYTEFSRYGEQIRRYIDVFGRDRILLLTMESMKENPESVAKQCFDFLNVDEVAALNTDRQNVTTAQSVPRLPAPIAKLEQRLPHAVSRWLPFQWIRPLFKEVLEPRSFGPEEEKLVFDLLRDDIALQQDMGIFSDQWTTTSRYV